ncbi:Methionine synthase reductase [Smittium culicis]|uniref:Methionine synthase reductase n=2 Tax=Smittium culicis TaxID=133412 RepID=A0A1R1YRQ3_9FUNG|nr:Methionine synthase reductase [Smittium culicis]
MNSSEIQIFFASESGNAEAVALDINKELSRIGIKSTVNEINKFLKNEYNKKTFAIFIISTYGEGEPPSNSVLCFRKLARRSKQALKSAEIPESAQNDSASSDYKHLHFCVLGLGDTNYSRFCNASKSFIGYLDSLGATGFYEHAFADDGLGLEHVIEPWTSKLFEKIHSFIEPLPASSSLENPSTPHQMGQNEQHSANHVELPSWNVNRKYSSSTNRSLFIDYSKLGKVDKLTGLPKLPKLSIALNIIPDSNPIDPTTLNSNGFPNSFQYPKWLFTSGSVDSNSSLNTNDLSSNDPNLDKVFLSRISSSECITAQDATKRTLLLDLDISEPNQNSSISFSNFIGNSRASNLWEAGDSFGIVAPNDPSQVSAILSRLGIDRNLWHLKISISIPSNSPAPSHLAQFVRLPSSPSSPSSHLSNENYSELQTPQNNLLVGENSLGNLPTLFELFLYKLDISSFPKKQILRSMADFCSDVADKSKLLLICSKNGLPIFNNLRESTSIVSLLDILNTFKSCKIPIDALVELLPPLVPRSYSISSSPITNKNSWKFAFNIVEHYLNSDFDKPSFNVPPQNTGTDAQQPANVTSDNFNINDIQNLSAELCDIAISTIPKKYGVCSSWIDSLCNYPQAPKAIKPIDYLQSHSLINKNSLLSALNSSNSDNNSSLEISTNTSNAINTQSHQYIPIFYRKSATLFRLVNPSSSGNLIGTRTNSSLDESDLYQRPIVMISSGTGITPFIGFLEQLANEQLGSEKKLNRSVHMYFGCRNKHLDFIFADKLGFFLKNTILSSLNVCFSRPHLHTTVSTASDCNAFDNAAMHNSSDLNAISSSASSKLVAEVDEKYKYVQDLLDRDAEKLTDLVLVQKARIFVCGNAIGMGKDVNSRLAEILLSSSKVSVSYKIEMLKLLDIETSVENLEKDLTIIDANKALMKLASASRYNRDLW